MKRSSTSKSVSGSRGRSPTAVTKAKKNVNIQDLATSQAFQPPIYLMVFLCLLPTLVLLAKISSTHAWIRFQLGVSVVVSIVGYLITSYMIPLVAPKLLPKLYGVDIGKRGLGGKHDGEKVPESMGIVSGCVFMICIGVIQVCVARGNDQLMEFNASLSSICFAVLLGLCDDIIDIKWKHKLQIGAFMALPLLISYQGGTTILIPEIGPLRKFFNDNKSMGDTFIGNLLQIEIDGEGSLFDLGFLYYVYMFVLIVFCTNSINIYAGINGLEVGQSVVMACSVSVVNLLELTWRGGSQEDILSGDGRNHLFSLMLMLPFISTSLALLKFNFYPAKVFVGDVYPYYAGMTLATSAILGHFAKSLFLLMVPQLLNFVYSLPQLFHFVPIPRHRLPKINLKTGFVEASKVAPNDDRANMTLLCAALRLFGPMHERTLCIVLLTFQVLCACLGIGFRYAIAGLF
uniref:UDP-N-acetylglucosamine--dolichyl-phosphate N-acetylglucosaminephosphotransferase n=4 Tax=Aplanochytrium stocchinoi TaxID=215587 RepID=A0A7S3LLJ7_9STRA|mmetsp:Transcript_11992/g.13960  ORF Transcript_11992/g.13960 Transcript_11992/m.13960 type:complete len:459 (-) Transcript_11992:364-1740(-)